MRAILTLLFICAISVAAFGQFNKKNKKPKGSNSASELPFSERIFFGGGGSFSGGTHPLYGIRYTYIAVSPLVGYRITLPWAVGLQLIYQTYRFNQALPSINQYGFAPFTQYRFGQLFGYAEYQMMSVQNQNADNRIWYDRLPLGIGFTQPIGPRAAINAVVLYDVLYNTHSMTRPFASPFIIRVYITAGGISF